MMKPIIHTIPMLKTMLCKKDTYMNKYTLSHLENDRDVTERAKGYTLLDASFMRQSWDSFLNV